MTKGKLEVASRSKIARDIECVRYRIAKSPGLRLSLIFPGYQIQSCRLDFLIIWIK